MFMTKFLILWMENNKKIPCFKRSTYISNFLWRQPTALVLAIFKVSKHFPVTIILVPYQSGVCNCNGVPNLCVLVMVYPPDPVSILRPSFPGIGVPMLKIRRSVRPLIFNMGIPLLVRRHLYIETVPRCVWLWWRTHQACMFFLDIPMHQVCGSGGISNRYV